MASRKRSESRKPSITGSKGLRHPVKHLKEHEKELKKMMGSRTAARKMVKKIKADLSKSKSKLMESRDKIVNDAENQFPKSRGALPNDTNDKMSNEKRLLTDLEVEFRPLTDILSDGALKLGAELDKRGPKPMKRKGTSKVKKRQSN